MKRHGWLFVCFTLVVTLFTANLLFAGPRSVDDSPVTKSEIRELKEEIEDLEKRLVKSERHAGLDRVNFSGDYRFEAHIIDASVPDHFDGMVLQNSMVKTMFYYGATGMHWVDFKIRDLQKAAGYRDGAPIPISAVFLAPPFNRRKERFKSVSAEVLKQSTDSFEGAMLDGFVASLRQAKEAEA